TRPPTPRQLEEHVQPPLHERIGWLPRRPDRVDQIQQGYPLRVLGIRDDFFANDQVPDHWAWRVGHGAYSGVSSPSTKSPIKSLSISRVMQFPDFSARSRSMASSISLTRNGRPWILFSPLASTRNIPRSNKLSCPLFNSGTSTFL